MPGCGRLEWDVVSRVRVRRPLIALIALVAAVAIGYGVRAVSGGDSAPPTPSTPAVSTHPDPPPG